MTMIMDCEKMSEKQGDGPKPVKSLQDLLGQASDLIKKPDAIFSFDSGEFNHFALWLTTKSEEDLNSHLNESINGAYEEFFKSPHYCYDSADRL